MEHREENAEAVLEPDLPICDPHHHLWNIPGRRYLLDEFLRDTSGGHRIESTVYVECGSYYRANGPEHLRPVGEVEFADRQAALAASGRYGATRVAAGIVAHADMMLGARVEEVLAAHVAAAPERLKGVRHVTAWDVSDRILGHGVVVPEMLAQPAFREAFAKLAMFGLSYDALGSIRRSARRPTWPRVSRTAHRLRPCGRSAWDRTLRGPPRRSLRNVETGDPGARQTT